MRHFVFGLRDWDSLTIETRLISGLKLASQFRKSARNLKKVQGMNRAMFVFPVEVAVGDTSLDHEVSGILVCCVTRYSLLNGSFSNCKELDQLAVNYLFQLKQKKFTFKWCYELKEI